MLKKATLIPLVSTVFIVSALLFTFYVLTDTPPGSSQAESVTSSISSITLSETPQTGEPIIGTSAIDTQTWTSGGITVTSSPIDGEPDWRESFEDEAGGAFYVWVDYLGSHNGGAGQVFGQYIDESGVNNWTADGIAIGPDTGGFEQTNAQAVTDGSGGLIASWVDSRTLPSQVYAQRVTSAGSLSWTATGVQVASTDNSQSEALTVSDDNGGSIIVWEERRLADKGVFAQKLNNSGAPQWGATGIALTEDTGITTSAALEIAIVADGSGGVIAVWRDSRDVGTTGTDIYAQKVNSSGVVQWTAGGVLVSNAAGNQSFPLVISDSSGGAIVGWRDQRTGSFDLFAQRINSGGTAQWTANGVLVCCTSSNGFLNSMADDGNGGAFFAWADGDIYIQRVDSSGTSSWGGESVVIANTANYQDLPEIVRDPNGGALVTWQDDGGGTNDDIYAQYIDEAGETVWTDNGIAIAESAADDQTPALVATGIGDTIVEWIDGDTFGIKSQKIITAFQILDLDSTLDAISEQTGQNIEDGSIYGVKGSSEVIELYDTSSAIIAESTVDMTTDRMWASVVGDTDTVNHKAFIASLESAPGAAGTFTLHVPKASSDQSVYICPGAASLATVTTSCSNGYELTESASNVTTTTISNQEYWVISDLDGTGGISVAGAPASSTTSASQSTTSLPTTGIFEYGIRLSTIFGALFLIVGLSIIVFKPIFSFNTVSTHEKFERKMPNRRSQRN